MASAGTGGESTAGAGTGRESTGGEFVQVLTATGSEEEAAAIASALLEGRLAGCVQVWGPVESRFWWEGRIDTAREWLCLAKTTAALYAEVETAIRERHSYDVPEILAVPVVTGSEAYLGWLAAGVGANPSPRDTGS